MNFARSRIDAHNNGDCDAATCPLCLEEIAEERAMSDHFVWFSEPCDCEAGIDHDRGQEIREGEL